MKKIREGRGLSLREAAAQMGFSHGSLWNYEEGRSLPHAYSDRVAIQQWTGGKVKIDSWPAEAPGPEAA